MIALVQDLLGPGAPDAHSLGAGGGESGSSDALRPNEINRATSEVERARDATHSAVALNRAAPGGNNQLRMSGPEASQVEKGMGSQPPTRVVGYDGHEV
jgi:hypothetical protein